MVPDPCLSIKISYELNQFKLLSHLKFLDSASPRRYYLKLSKFFAVQFFCSITAFVMQKFHLTCTCILCILDEFLNTKWNSKDAFKAVLDTVSGIFLFLKAMPTVI